MVCSHNELEFRDQGNRIVCKNGECNRSWYRETSPGSYMPFLGVVPIEEMQTNYQTRSNPYSIRTIENSK
jgi:hypothetical protein